MWTGFLTDSILIKNPKKKYFDLAHAPNRESIPSSDLQV